ncbi:MAG: hypothetical protein MJ249_08020 [Kiritimatiellae bacterium]|nr:hypothetical protein [Kiritimatiellia bacterium]
MIENIQSVCVNTAYACAAGVGAVVVAYGVARGMKFLSGGVKCLAAASLAGSLIIGGMTVTGVHIAGAKTNDTQQVGGDLSNTNDIGQVEGTTNILRGVVQGRARIPAAPQGTANVEANVPALRRSRSLRPTGMAPVTDEDIARRWRVVSVSSNSVDASVFAFEQSNNQTIEQSPVVWEAAQRRGAVFGAWHIPLEGWQFPFDDYGWLNAFMRCEGDISNVKCKMENVKC